MPLVLGVIPARTGLKRIPNKNFRDFAGKVLLLNSFEHAQKTKVLDHF